MSTNPRQSIGQFSKFCNETIEDGVDATPLPRRWLTSRMVFVQPVVLGLPPAILSTTVVCTIAAVLLGVIFSRPQMRVFPPFISNVRLEVPTYLPGFKCVRHVSGPKVTAETIRLLEMEIAKRGAEFARFDRPVEDLVDFCSVSDRDFDEGLIVEEVQQEDADSKVPSDGSSEVLPRVHMDENLRGEHPQVSSEEFDYHTFDEILDTRRMSVSDASSVIPPALADYYARRGDAAIFRERLIELNLTRQEGLIKRELSRDRGDEVEPVTDAEFEHEFAARREESTRQIAAAEEAAEVAYDTCVKYGVYPDSMRAETLLTSQHILDLDEPLRSLYLQLDKLDKLEEKSVRDNTEDHENQRKRILKAIEEAEAEIPRKVEEVDTATAGARIKAWLASLTSTESLEGSSELTHVSPEQVQSARSMPNGGADFGPANRERYGGRRIGQSTVQR